MHQIIKLNPPNLPLNPFAANEDAARQAHRNAQLGPLLRRMRVLASRRNQYRREIVHNQRLREQAEGSGDVYDTNMIDRYLGRLREAQRAIQGERAQLQEAIERLGGRPRGGRSRYRRRAAANQEQEDDAAEDAEGDSEEMSDQESEGWRWGEHGGDSEEEEEGESGEEEEGEVGEEEPTEDRRAGTTVLVDRTRGPHHTRPGPSPGFELPFRPHH